MFSKRGVPTCHGNCNNRYKSYLTKNSSSLSDHLFNEDEIVVGHGKAVHVARLEHPTRGNRADDTSAVERTF